MYRGFNLEISEDNIGKLSHYIMKGEELYNDDKKIVSKVLDDINAGSMIENILEQCTENDQINAEKLQNIWFPIVPANVFLSHSHRDIRLAKWVAGFLSENFGLQVFIDSAVWGYANELLKVIDNEYCKNECGQTYNYRKRNSSTSHVHMMLSAALNKMIDDTECIIFLNTKNSIKKGDFGSTTPSPWIYSELMTTQLIRRTPKEKHREKFTLSHSFNEQQNMCIQYLAPLQHLSDLKLYEIFEWEKKYSERKKSFYEGPEDSLDDLYALIKEKKRS